jgi:hypothetical protein
MTADAPDNTQVSVTPGVVPTDITMTMDLTPLPAPSPPGFRPLRTGYTFGPSGQTFNAPGVQVIFQYGPGDIPPGTRPEELSVYVYDSLLGDWVLHGGVVNHDPFTNSGTITVFLDHFSDYAMFAPIDEDMDGCSDAQEIANQDIPREPDDPKNRNDFGDVTFDGAVNFNDFLKLLQAWNKSTGQSGYHPYADLDTSGQVGFGDFLVILQSWNRKCEP